jgi:hypothetical protein
MVMDTFMHAWIAAIAPCEHRRFRPIPAIGVGPQAVGRVIDDGAVLPWQIRWLVGTPCEA